MAAREPFPAPHDAETQPSWRTYLDGEPRNVDNVQLTHSLREPSPLQTVSGRASCQAVPSTGYLSVHALQKLLQVSSAGGGRG